MMVYCNRFLVYMPPIAEAGTRLIRIRERIGKNKRVLFSSAASSRLIVSIFRFKIQYILYFRHVKTTRSLQHSTLTMCF